MKFLIDADMPRSTGRLLKEFGYEATDVRDVGLAAADDSEIAMHALEGGFCLLTGDFGFADVRNYPRLILPESSWFKSRVMQPLLSFCQSFELCWTARALLPSCPADSAS